MKIWHLKRKTDRHERDVVNAFVIVAANGPDARDLAARRAGDEGPKTWTDASLSTCRSIGEASGHLRNKTRHVIAVDGNPAG